MIERTFIQEGIKDVELENYLKKELSGAGFTCLEIQKTPLVTRVILNVTKAGMVIGKKGQNIRRLTKEIEERFKIDNPQLEIKQIERPELDARAMVDRMIGLLNRGFSWRSVSYRAVRDIMRAGAMGVEIKLAGKLGGKGARKMRKRLIEGYMKKVGFEAKLVDYAKGPAYTKGGAIGIKIRIVRPGTVFTDKLSEGLFVKEAVVEKPAVVEEKPIEVIEEKKKAVEAVKAEPEKKQKEPRKKRVKKETVEKKEQAVEEKAGEKEKAKETTVEAVGVKDSEVK